MNFCSAFISLTEVHVFSMSTAIRKFMNFCSAFIFLTEIHFLRMSTETRKFMNFCSAFISLTEIHVNVFRLSSEIRKFIIWCHFLAGNSCVQDFNRRTELHDFLYWFHFLVGNSFFNMSTEIRKFMNHESWITLLFSLAGFMCYILHSRGWKLQRDSFHNTKPFYP